MPEHNAPVNDAYQPDCLPGMPHPRSAAALYGHSRIEADIIGAIHGEKLPHAWILGGAPGIGKATLAYRFARFLLAGGAGGRAAAKKADSLAIDPGDTVFQQVAAGTHPDLFVLRRTFDEKKKRWRKEIGAHDVRRVSRFFAHTSNASGWRICLIDSADEMNRTAANALLKVLEEPPRRGLFVLISNNPGRLLATIRSRCRLVRLTPVGDDLVKRVLERLTNRKGKKPSADELTALAALSRGSPGLAVRLHMDGGLAMQAKISRLLDGLPDLDRAGALALSAALSRDSAEGDYRLFCTLLSNQIARAVRAGAMGNGGGADAGDAALSERLGMSRHPEIWAGAWRKFEDAVRQADALNLDRRQVVLNALFDLEATAHRTLGG